MSTLAKSNRLSVFTHWPRSFWQRVGLAFGFVAANLLYATFACAQDTLHHIDPVVFTALQMTLLVPGALICCYRSRRLLTAQILRQGGIAGLLLGLGFVGVALTLRNIGIVRAAMLMSLDGVMASYIARYVLRQRQARTTWLATLCATSGAILLWFISPGAWQADILALLVDLLFCGYALYVEQTGLLIHPTTGQMDLFFGIMFVTMLAVSLLVALCFGTWTSLQAFSHTDFSILIYTGCCTVMLPLLVNTLLQRYVTAIAVSFAAVLEPLAAIGFAYQQHALHLALLGWIGIVCIVFSLLIIATGSLSKPGTETLSRRERREL